MPGKRKPAPSDGDIIPRIEARADTGERGVANHGYDTDLVLWAEDQARALREAARTSSNHTIDWENVAEEIEALGRSEHSSLANYIGTVIEHLARLEASPASEPRIKWQETILRTRRDIQRLLKNNPGLVSGIDNVIEEEHAAALELVSRVLALYDETPLVPVHDLQYTTEQVLENWWPPPGHRPETEPRPTGARRRRRQ
jgi:uncharacterized protein DUF29